MPRTRLEKLRHPRTARQLLAVRVTVLAIVTVVLDLVGAAAFVLLERGAEGTKVTNYGDALFWTSSQITTVSSSLPNPLTTGGRILAVAIDFVSIAVISLLFGVIAQHIHVTSPHRSGSDQVS